MKPEGFPPSVRVRKRADFKRAYDEGSKVVMRPFVLFARPNGLAASRLGVTATRKLGPAVLRNRARRILREAYRRCQSELPPGHDLVVVARPALLDMSPASVTPLFRDAVERATRAAA